MAATAHYLTARIVPSDREQGCLQVLEKGLAISTGSEVCNPLAPTCAEGCPDPPAAAEEGINRDCPAQHDLNRGNLIGICITQDSMKAACKRLQHWGVSPRMTATLRIVRDVLFMTQTEVRTMWIHRQGACPEHT